jgi:hypothetical protein
MRLRLPEGTGDREQESNIPPLAPAPLSVRGFEVRDSRKKNIIGTGE